MRGVFCQVLIALLLIGGCSHSGTGVLPSGARFPASLDPQRATLNDALESLVTNRQLPGAIAVITRDDEILTRVVVGWQDVEHHVPLHDDALFRLYSMSKPITSVAIMMLVEEGRLGLDDPASRFLPEFESMRVYVSGGLDDIVTEPARRPITIRDLLTHMSGITYHFTGATPVHAFYRKYGVMRDTPVGRMPGDGAPARTLDELVTRIGKAPLLHQPGEQFAYSYSTTVLGAVIERASGQRLDRFLKDRIFAPLGMNDTGFFVEDGDLQRFTTLYAATPEGIAPAELPATSDYRDHGRLLDGGGALVGTANDYLRFAQMLANGGKLGDVRILDAATIDLMFTPQTKVEGLGAQSMAFGLGFSLGDAESAAAGTQPAGTASWSGSGNTYFFVDPDTRMVALLMTHILTPGSEAERSAVFRRVLSDAAASFVSD